MYEDTKEVIEITALILGALLGFTLLALLIGYIVFNIEVSRAVQCIEVYDGDELIYRGNEYFSITASRGVSTIWQEKEAKFFLPRTLNERISADIRSNNCIQK